ncbi:MAG TPA: hypothetical protein VF006_09630 [Longimicrobium sp.]
MTKHDTSTQQGHSDLLSWGATQIGGAAAVRTDATNAEYSTSNMEVVATSDDTAKERIRRGDELLPEEQQRLLTHGLHEENVFYNRLNFFMVCESLLFAAAVTAISGENPRATLIVLPICILGLLVSTLWLYVQLDKLVLLRVLEVRAEEAFLEFKETIGLAEQQRLLILRKEKSVSGVLAWTFPLLFILAWIGLGVITLLIE